jgi:hypothetical protein
MSNNFVDYGNATALVGGVADRIEKDKFIGTKDDWEQLSLGEKAAYDGRVVNITNDIPKGINVPVVDSVEEGNYGAVTSNAVSEAIEDLGLGTASKKNFTNSITSGSNDLITSGAVFEKAVNITTETGTSHISKITQNGTEYDIRNQNSPDLTLSYTSCETLQTFCERVYRTIDKSKVNVNTKIKVGSGWRAFILTLVYKTDSQMCFAGFSNSNPPSPTITTHYWLCLESSGAKMFAGDLSYYSEAMLGQASPMEIYY